MSDASLQHWREGVGAYNTGNVQLAIQEFKAAAPSKGVLFNLGVSTAKMGDNQTAIRHFDEVIQMDPNLGVAYLTRGACKHHERMYDAAIKDYDQALNSVGERVGLDYSSEGLQFEMHRVDLLFNRALALKELGRVSEAQADAARARQLVDAKTMSRQPALEKLANQLSTLSLAQTGAAPAPPPPASSAYSAGFTQPPAPRAPPPVPPPSSGQAPAPSSSTPAAPPAAPPPQVSLPAAPSQPAPQKAAPPPPAPEAAAAPPPEQPAAPPSQPKPAAPAPAAPPAAATAADPPAGFFTLEQLTNKPYPDGVDPTKRETYLTDDEFQKVFNCSKDDLQAMPQWKRELLKKKKGLF